MQRWRIAATCTVLLTFGACSASDTRCTTMPNPRECARVIRAGGAFEDYRRNGLGGYTFAQMGPARLYAPGTATQHIASYDSAISRFEGREIRRRNARFSRETRRAARANREYRAARAARHH